MKVRVVMLSLAVLAAGLAGSASGATYRWSGNSGSSWFDTGNWSPSGIPGEDDEALGNIPSGMTELPEDGPTIEAGEVIYINELHMPTYSDPGSQEMVVNGGTIYVDDRWRFANGSDTGTIVGTLTINGGEIIVDGDWRASDSNNTIGIFNFNGGAISCDNFKLGD
ncbi:MAG: hypothetical protein ACYTEQ_11765, partial [Planctomycetota bacterium]